MYKSDNDSSFLYLRISRKQLQIPISMVIVHHTYLMNIDRECIRCEVCYAIAKVFTAYGEAIDFPFKECNVLQVHCQPDMQFKDNNLHSEACHPLKLPLREVSARSVGLPIRANARQAKGSYVL